MTSIKDISQNIAAAMAALAVTGVCVLGTVGPVQAGNTGEPVELQADQDEIIIVTGRIA
ncbi:hypothetical protein HFP57_04130 [Parasphingopyxis algicola]|uniref:hypothetical protein n=1 Tax=Parasphingopyxis algicola TaxID=2026624 RepID=UPI0015A2F82D|nr:hypothetical protein [Parasphingopyxis algicola]QLC24296.1 hypothetical protein HFP57_04130 [Parasphingopyxis algicola]